MWVGVLLQGFRYLEVPPLDSLFNACKYLLVGSWVLSLKFYGWCIKIVSAIFISTSSYMATHVFCFSMAIISYR